MRKKMRLSKTLIVLSLFMVICYSGSSCADVSLPSVIGENMVLQRDMELSLWGWADSGEEVSVAINGQRQSITADNSGTWSVRLAPLKAGGPYDLVIQGKNTIEFKNVMVGDVWICSGQSNMEMRVRHVRNSDNEVAEALYPNLHLFQITNDLSPEPREDCEGRWERCRPSTIGDFSAAAYFFRP